MNAALAAALKKILEEDIPTLPTHHHEGPCACVATVAYLRVSRVGKRTKLVSPTIQLNAIIADAKRNNRRIVKLLFDINKTGRDFDRDAFEEALADVKAGLYKHVSVWMWSRFGRTLRGSLAMLGMLDEIDGIVDSASEPYDHDSVFGEFTRDQALLIADLQSKLQGQTWRSVHATRLEDKLPHSGRKRFGYDYNAEDERNKRYEINEIEAPILRWAYEQYVSGASIRGIVAEVNAQGFVTMYGNPWSHGAWMSLMDTGFAAGLLRSRSAAKLKEMKRKPANTRRSFDAWNEGSQPAIIDMDLWRQYETIRNASEYLPARSIRAVHELSALLFCGLCATRLTTQYPGRSRMHRWVCQGRDTRHPGRAVGIRNVDALEIVREYMAEKSQPEWIEQESRRMHEETTGARSEADQIAADLRKAEGQAAKVLDLYLASDDNNEAAKTRVLARMNELDEKVSELKKRKAALTADGSAPNWRAFGDIAERWDEFEPPIHNAALRAVVGMVVVSPPASPRLRSDLRERVRVVPLWEVEEWSDWLVARRQRSAWARA